MTDQEINEAVAVKLGCKCEDPLPEAHHGCDGFCHWPENCPVPDRINRAVAEKLGTVKTSFVHDPIDGAPLNQVRVDSYPDYCHSIEAAWEVVEAWRSKVNFELYGQENRHYVAWFKYQDGLEYFGEADTAPMAICLAFLKLEDPG